VRFAHAMIVAFLAVLEMVRCKPVVLMQSEHFKEIRPEEA